MLTKLYRMSSNKKSTVLRTNSLGRNRRAAAVTLLRLTTLEEAPPVCRRPTAQSPQTVNRSARYASARGTISSTVISSRKGPVRPLLRRKSARKNFSARIARGTDTCLLIAPIPRMCSECSLRTFSPLSLFCYLTCMHVDTLLFLLFRFLYI